MATAEEQRAFEMVENHEKRIKALEKMVDEMMNGAEWRDPKASKAKAPMGKD